MYCGPDFTESINAEVEAMAAEVRAVGKEEIDRCLAAIKDEETSQYMKSSHEELIAAKKEYEALQLEAAKRSRMNERLPSPTIGIEFYILSSFGDKTYFAAAPK